MVNAECGMRNERLEWIPVETNMNDRITLANGAQTVTFVRGESGYRPEWFRLADRPMLRFKNHEFLNIGAIRVTSGELFKQGDNHLLFRGAVEFGGITVNWLVTVLVAEQNCGFVVTTHLMTPEPIELLEGLSTFELPYEYSDDMHHLVVIPQQPVYKFEGQREISGQGFVHPLWYYARHGSAHLTIPSSTPILLSQISEPGGANMRCTMLRGEWKICDIHDLFCQPRNKRVRSLLTFRLLPGGSGDEKAPDPFYRSKLFPPNRRDETGFQIPRRDASCTRPATANTSRCPRSCRSGRRGCRQSIGHGAPVRKNRFR